MTDPPGPLLTEPVHAALLEARRAGTPTLVCSLDLGRSTTQVRPGAGAWVWGERTFPYLQACRPRAVYYWNGSRFEEAARFSASLVKLVPTTWGPPTFEIDGIKMLPTSRVSPFEDARHKVDLVHPTGKVILDTCGGLGYFAACCLSAGAALVRSYEKNPDVIWLRSVNPWSPDGPWNTPRRELTLTSGDVAREVAQLPDRSFDAILHDPPRFARAGELYSEAFYAELARLLRRAGRLFHYTGSPNRVSRGRDLAAEVISRLRRTGFSAVRRGDGVLAVRGGRVSGGR